MRPETRSLRWARLLARAPRVVLLTAAVALAAAGARSTVAGSPRPGPPAAQRTGTPQVVTATAEAFARAYLTWTPDPATHERAVAPYLADSLDPGAGLIAAPGAVQTVRWTAVAGASADGPRRWRVLVAAATSRSETVQWLSVPVSLDPYGAVAVYDYPSPSGPPPHDPSAGGLTGEPVSDQGLLEVARRAIGNYLMRNGDDLRADLAPGARLTLPTVALTPGPIDELTRTAAGRLAADLTVTDSSQTRMRIRMRLVVERHDRWLVRAINPTPTKEP